MIINSFTGKYRFLSNFYPCNILVENIIYPSVEHAYQAAKTNNIEDKLTISLLKKPGEAKQFGQKVQLREQWENEKILIMTLLVKQKFQNPSLHNKLLETNNAELIEGNYWGDTFWGQCNGVGENWLGKILMNERKKLQDDNLFIKIIERGLNAN